MPEPLVYLDGRLLLRSRARVPVGDRCLRFGDGVIETLRARGCRSFRLSRHLQRLRRSAGRLGWDLPWDDAGLAAAVDAVLAANRLPEARVRILASSGPGGLRDAVSAPWLLVEAEPFVPVPEALRTTGASAVVAPWRRAAGGPAGGAKTAAYLESLVALREAQARGADESLLLNPSGEIAEAAAANVFAVAGGRLRTPAADACLPGITREAVLELAAAAGLPVREGPLPLADLVAAEEAFLTSTGVEVLPLTSVEGRPVGDGRPGPRSRVMLEAYRRLLEREIGVEGR